MEGSEMGNSYEKAINIPKLKLFCEEEQEKISPSKCTGLIKSYKLITDKTITFSLYFTRYTSYRNCDSVIVLLHEVIENEVLCVVNSHLMSLQ